MIRTTDWLLTIFITMAGPDGGVGHQRSFEGFKTYESCEETRKVYPDFKKANGSRTDIVSFRTLCTEHETIYFNNL